MLVHILLVASITTQIILSIGSFGGYSGMTESLFYKMFLSDDLDLNEIDYDKNVYFYNIGDVREFVNTSVNNYYNLPNSDVFEEYYIPQVYNGSNELIDEPISLEAFYRREYNKKADFLNITYNLTAGDLGPFERSDSDLKRFFANITHIRLRYNIQTIIPSQIQNSSD